MKEYKYDIAISLCKQDVAYAKSLVNELNQKLDVFFYEDNQKEIVGQLGFEKFGDVFKHEARVVVILYRKEWGESTYTELERAAIQDRMNDANQGQSFLMLIAMDSYKAPGWYPSSRIYADPFKFPVSEMAEFIEYKVNERGGNVRLLTFEDKVALVEQKRKDKIAHQQFLESRESVELVHRELNKLIQVFNTKIKNPQIQQLHTNVGFKPIHQNGIGRDEIGNLVIGKFRLHLSISEFRLHADQLNSQYVTIDLGIYPNGSPISGNVNDRTHEASYKFNTDQKHLTGWSEVTLENKKHSYNPKAYEFLSLNDYKLGVIVPTETLLDKWFSNLLDRAEIK